MLAIGLMSGTSVDGVDAALVETDGDGYYKAIETHHLPYSVEFQSKLRSLFDDYSSWLRMEKELTEKHFECVEELLVKANRRRDEVKIIGFHGQTVFHKPAEGLTWQIGNAHLLAHLSGIDVVSDFRRRDVVCGGEGAPLVPIFHKCLCVNEEKPVAVLNIGGVANVTYIGDHKTLSAFDTGPGNALINDAMMKHFNQSFDEDGRVAIEGHVHQELVDDLLRTNPYFTRPPPKSLDRNDFCNSLVQFEHLDARDLVATLTRLTVDSILLGIRSLPSYPRRVYVCGGGCKNSTLMSWLNASGISEFSSMPQSDFIEAQAFAYLAVRFLKRLPSSFPSTTNSRKEIVCGVLFEA